MTLRVSGKNLDIGEALRQHFVERVQATVAGALVGFVDGYGDDPRRFGYVRFDRATVEGILQILFGRFSCRRIRSAARPTGGANIPATAQRMLSTGATIDRLAPSEGLA